ncbi:MAG: UvrABC system protein C [Desulfotomaculum sp. 46_296]|nr:MAG: UvrABC system protein C [Desulfotomaculum sp. 46_296]HAU32617.1 excinuclease ABC subunit C [Desulfotomaculum sp.]
MLEEKLTRLPSTSGVYFFKDAEGKVIYVGKAVSLKNRVRSYYHAGAGNSPKVRSLVERAVDFEYIITDNEVEALILESNLIKEHRPRYNILLKDDKSYPYLKISLKEEFPRIQITRNFIRDGSVYFGPYTQVGAIQDTLNLLRKLFPFRTCNQKITKIDGGFGKASRTNRPCLNHHLNQCLAPCSGLVAQEEYLAMIQEVCLFMEGRQEDVVKRIALRMDEASKKLDFENAAKFRDQIKSIELVIEKQKVILKNPSNLDIIAAAAGQGICCAMVFYMRSGKLISREHFLLSNTEDLSNAEIITAFIKQHYNNVDFVPEKILLSGIMEEEKGVVAAWLSCKRGGKVKLCTPRSGENKQLIEMVEKNAVLALREAEITAQKKQFDDQALEELRIELDLQNTPARIECYDISNTQGFENVASMVVYDQGRITPEHYRKFKIRTVEGPNDYACLQEALKRRFLRARQEKELLDSGRLSTKKAGFHRLPDLIIVDGGAGQLSCARQVMRETGFEYIPACSIAKGEEVIYMEEKDEPIRLPSNSPALRLVQRLRDEAHRFALAYHRKLHASNSLSSILNEIKGIGKVRRLALLSAFPSLTAISKATLSELTEVPGMTLPAAQAVYNFFH